MPVINGKNVTLLEYSAQFRTEEIARNKYTKNNEFGSSHPDAIADGDDLGKNENNGVIGSRTDISKRNELQSKNLYTINNPYDGSKVE